MEIEFSGDDKVCSEAVVPKDKAGVFIHVLWLTSEGIYLLIPKESLGQFSESQRVFSDPNKDGLEMGYHMYPTSESFQPSIEVVVFFQCCDLP